MTTIIRTDAVVDVSDQEPSCCSLTCNWLQTFAAGRVHCRLFDSALYQGLPGDEPYRCADCIRGQVPPALPTADELSMGGSPLTDVFERRGMR